MHSPGEGGYITGCVPKYSEINTGGHLSCTPQRAKSLSVWPPAGGARWWNNELHVSPPAASEIIKPALYFVYLQL